MSGTYDIAVVGAGAAGLSAGIFAAEAARRSNRILHIVLLDGASTVGAKILVSGGGRCNVAPDRITPADYNGSRNIIRNILAAFDEQATAAWFERMGVKLRREDTGKLFPVSNSARDVLAALLRQCSELGVEIRTSHRVLDVRPATDGFGITAESAEILARRVVLATGGQSLPRTGSDGYGWEIARRLGHAVTPTYPALAPLVLDEGFFHAELSGLSIEAELTTLANGKIMDRRTGSLLWTHFGISGPVAMDASRHWVIAKASGVDVTMRCSVTPGISGEAIDLRLQKLAGRSQRLAVRTLLAGITPQRLGDVLLRHCGIDPSSSISQLGRERRRSLASALTALPLPVLRDRGWNYAEVTAGGVPLAEINYRTLQSRRAPGLYLIGEMLDCDGRIGGFNFQWAWATGFIAGRAAAASVFSSAE